MRAKKTEGVTQVMYKHGLRRWWTWFYKYKGVVKEYEDEIHKHGLTMKTSAEDVQLPQ
ncbi:MAG: hypothetical protein K2X93_05305 [Candidatus Obscuribacterales bacterium]|nr:hypothetical protein [Candidatus Obscuribacterales bacterium]